MPTLGRFPSGLLGSLFPHRSPEQQHSPHHRSVQPSRSILRRRAPPTPRTSFTPLREPAPQGSTSRHHRRPDHHPRTHATEIPQPVASTFPRSSLRVTNPDPVRRHHHRSHRHRSHTRGPTADRGTPIEPVIPPPIRGHNPRPATPQPAAPNMAHVHQPWLVDQVTVPSWTHIPMPHRAVFHPAAHPPPPAAPAPAPTPGTAPATFVAGRTPRRRRSRLRPMPTPMSLAGSVPLPDVNAHPTPAAPAHVPPPAFPTPLTIHHGVVPDPFAPPGTFTVATTVLPGVASFGATPVWGPPPVIYSTPASPPHSLPGAALWNTPAAPAGATLHSQAWVPHPAPHPTVPSQHFWRPPITQVSPYPHPATLPPMHVPILAGGAYPMPGTAPASYRPSTTNWPPARREVPIHLAPWLVPNPSDPEMPSLEWDVTHHPSSGRFITERHVFVPLDARALDAPAVFPNAERVVVVPNVGLWGAIPVEKPGGVVSVGDILEAIYEFFQRPLKRAEYDAIVGRREDAERELREACWERCRRAGGLPAASALQGYKRVDVLGGCTVWWGMWVILEAGSNTWTLHLGLVPRR